MPLRTDLPVWRSLLFVPVIAKKFVDGAASRGADGIILDIEDSVPPAEKPRARTLLQEAAETVSRGGADVLVRINRPLRLAVPDIEAAISPQVQALALPKVESANHLRLLCEVIDELEADRGMVVGTTKLLVMIETAEAFFDMPAIARADPRVVAMTLGAEDFALSVGMLPEAEGLLFPKQQMIIAARAAGILPLGSWARSPISATSRLSAPRSSARAVWASWVPPASTRASSRSSTRSMRRNPTTSPRPSASSWLTRRRPPKASARSQSMAR